MKNTTILIISISALALVVIFVAAANLIVVDPCASPCADLNELEALACPGVCIKKTLWDAIFGKYGGI